ncbi:hypothetical protein [Aureibacillus halotolerans]|nr:hypothetical protein [Aureibacillus halotolerans]
MGKRKSSPRLATTSRKNAVPYQFVQKKRIYTIGKHQQNMIG